MDMLLYFLKKFVTNCHYGSLISDEEMRQCRTLIKYMRNTFRKHFSKLLKILTASMVIVNSAHGCVKLQKNTFYSYAKSEYP